MIHLSRTVSVFSKSLLYFNLNPLEREKKIESEKCSGVVHVFFMFVSL